ncbi:MAG: Tex-like N-terminal domain-containing protein, partial [Bacteroidales bacterium]|nr:Tex-like N-terminal domain-containing protein [Bacteroidales bacterium]
MHEIAIYASLISKELNLDYQNVRNTLSLLAEGATIPFIARYRKEKTGSMDEEVIAALQKRLQQLQALDKRKETVLASIAEQDKLTPELKKLIEEAATMQDLEDIYLPYKPKRRTRATIAREKGLEPLALFLLEHQFKSVETEAKRFVSASKGVNDISEALAGARDIVAEMVAENR